MKRLGLVALLCVVWKLRGAEVIFTPSATPSITNYSIYYGPSPSRSGTNRVHIGTNTSWTITNVAPATAAFVFASAWASNGVESVPSNEILYTNRNFAPVIQLNMILEKATSPAGPFESTTNQLTFIAASEPNTFFRVRVEATQP